MLGKDTYLNTKNGLIEYQDGRKIEFIHKNAIMNGPAIEYLANGDKIEFNYVNGKRYGEAQKFYANGDKEDFFYGIMKRKMEHLSTILLMVKEKKLHIKMVF